MAEMQKHHRTYGIFSWLPGIGLGQDPTTGTTEEGPLIMTRTWFVTGASRGMGRELGEQLLAGGDRVAATLRRPEQLDDLTAEYGDRLWVAALDVTDTARLRAVVTAAFAAHDRID